MAAARVIVRSSRHRLRDRRVNADRDPREDTVRDIITEENVRRHGVAGRGLLAEDTVLGVCGKRLGVGRVRRRRLHLGDQVLVEEQLADVRDGAAGEGLVGVGRRVDVRQDVDVRRATRVVAREQRHELQHAVVVGDLDSAQGRVVQVGRVVGVAVVLSDDAAVDALSGGEGG